MIDYKNRMETISKKRAIIEKVQIVAEALILLGVLAFMQSIQP